jgi:hypothetical protein
VLQDQNPTKPSLYGFRGLPLGLGVTLLSEKQCSEDCEVTGGTSGFQALVSRTEFERPPHQRLSLDEMILGVFESCQIVEQRSKF